MVLLLNIGNTYTQRGVWDGTEMELLPRCPTAELSSAVLPPGVEVAAACVVPEVRRRLSDSRIFWLEANNCGGMVDFSQVDCSTLGADRVANVLAASAFCRLPAVVVDCGTAITLELIDGGRVFRGGAIAPGRRLMRQALAAGTAQLPEIPFSQSFPQNPGNGTVESIRFGVDCGAVGLVRELVGRSCRALEGTASAVVTGGDADFFAGALPELEAMPADFTLQGLRLGWERRG